MEEKSGLTLVLFAGVSTPFFRLAAASIDLVPPPTSVDMVFYVAVFFFSLFYLSFPGSKGRLGAALARLRGRVLRAVRAALSGPGLVSPWGRSLAARPTTARTPGDVAPRALAVLGRTEAEPRRREVRA